MFRRIAMHLIVVAFSILLSGCIHGEAQWITAQGREQLIYVDASAKEPGKFTVYAMGGKQQSPKQWVLPGALQTARKLGYRCLQVLDIFHKPLGSSTSDYNESWLTAQASMETCSTDQAKQRYDLNLNIQKLEPGPSNFSDMAYGSLPARIQPPTATPQPTAKPAMPVASLPAQLPVLDMANYSKPAVQLPPARNLQEAIQRIETQLAQYPEFKITPYQRSAGLQLYDLLTFHPTSPPTPIRQFETVDVPFFTVCSTVLSHFIDNDKFICSTPAAKKPKEEEKVGHYRLNFEINLKTGQVTPHPELSYDFPGLPVRGDIRCFDPVTKFMQIEVASQKPEWEKIQLQGYWGGKVEAYHREYGTHLNEYTCKNVANEIVNSDIGNSRYDFSHFKYLREDGWLMLNRIKLSDVNREPLQRKGYEHVYTTQIGFGKMIYLPFMDSYIDHDRTNECDRGKGNKHIFWNSRRGEWYWPVPDAITRPTDSRGCDALHAKPMQPGMVWMHSPNATDTKGIHFQQWDKPESLVKLADDAATPFMSSPDGCYLIYAHFVQESYSRAGIYNRNLYQRRATNFCKSGV